MSIRISSWFLSNPYVRMMTEFLSSTFLSLMVSNISFISLGSDGAPSVRNKMTLFLAAFPASSETEPLSSSKAFSKAGVNLVWPVKEKKSSHEPGPRRCRSLSRFPKHEATMSIASPPGKDASS